MPIKGWPHKRTIVYSPQPRVQKVKRFRLLNIIGKALKRTATTLGALVLFSMTMSVVITLFLASDVKQVTVPEKTVLVFRLDGAVPEKEMSSAFSGAFGFYRPSVRELVDAIDYAAKDDRVKGLVFSFRNGGLSLAHMEEIRKAVLRFKESGKFTKAYALSYESATGGLGRYYLASAFDQIWMQPVGTVSMAGIYAEMPFAGDLLKRLGVTPQFFQRKEYKTAMENFTKSSMSDENREELETVLGTIFDHMITGIAKGRGLSEDKVRALVDQGLFTGKEAVEAGLIDRLEYGDIAVNEIKKELTGNPESEEIELFLLKRYALATRLNPPPSFHRTAKKKVAIVYVSGAIVTTGDNVSPYTIGQDVAAADVLSEAITNATDDDDVKAIVIRVNSPGGSPVASETIRRAILRAKEKDKLVVVSMGDMAASGGYWISTHADYIFALPETLTGSIGVVGGKFALGGFWDKIDVNWDSIQFGDNASMLSMNKPFSKAGQARYEVMLDDIYDGFIARVSEGRGLSVEETERIAKGRVWDGVHAKEHKLVDALGGIDESLDYVAVKLGKKDRHDLNIVSLPREKTPFERFINLLEQQVLAGQFMRNQAAVYEALSPIANHIIRAQNMQEHILYEPLDPFVFK